MLAEHIYYYRNEFNKFKNLNKSMTVRFFLSKGIKTNFEISFLP